MLIVANLKNSPPNFVVRRLAQIDKSNKKRFKPSRLFGGFLLPAFAVNSGFNSMLVLSGETTKEIYEQRGMNLSVVFDSVNDWVEYL